MGTQRWGAVVLTGGTGARMGGVDKAALEVGGVTLLERALAATAGAARVVVVGEEVPTSRAVTWAREDPPLGGPAAGVLAGLDRLGGCPVVAVLAVDMPRVTAATLRRLADAAVPSVDGAVLVDADGRRQPLCGVYRREALLRSRPSDGSGHGVSMRRLLAALALVEVPAVGQETEDVDTWAALHRLRGD